MSGPLTAEQIVELRELYALEALSGDYCRMVTVTHQQKAQRVLAALDELTRWRMGDTDHLRQLNAEVGRLVDALAREQAEVARLTSQCDDLRTRWEEKAADTFAIAKERDDARDMRQVGLKALEDYRLATQKALEQIDALRAEVAREKARADGAEALLRGTSSKALVEELDAYRAEIRHLQYVVDFIKRRLGVDNEDSTEALAAELASLRVVRDATSVFCQSESAHDECADDSGCPIIALRAALAACSESAIPEKQCESCGQMFAAPTGEETRCAKCPNPSNRIGPWDGDFPVCRICHIWAPCEKPRKPDAWTLYPDGTYTCGEHSVNRACPRPPQSAGETKS